MIKGLKHVGMSVADLDRSLAFYRDLFGMKIVGQGPFSGGHYEAILGLNGARGRVALLQVGDLQLELFEFERPAGARGERLRPVCDHGITHFCVEVADLDALYERWLRAGVNFHCPPLTFFGTVKATYGRDPDGNVFELIEPLDRKS